MQPTLDDLRKATDPLAALCARSDSDLDRLAAEIQGWEHFYGNGPEWWCIPCQHGTGLPQWKVSKYRPTRDLNQAYAIIDATGMEVHRWAYATTPMIRYAIALGAPTRVTVTERQAGSHERAVAILGILGLLQSQKDGAA